MRGKRLLLAILWAAALSGCAGSDHRPEKPSGPHPNAGWMRRLDGAMETGVASPQLLDRAMAHPDGRVRLLGARAIGVLAPPNAVTLLSSHVSAPEAPEVRVAAIFALGLLHRPEALAPLETVLANDPDPLLRRHAAVALGRITPPPLGAPTGTGSVAPPATGEGGISAAVVPLLLGGLDDPDPRVRGAAALAVWHHGESAAVAIDRLVALLDDTDPEVRWRAAYALMRIEDPRTSTPLRLRLKSSDSLVRTFAAWGARQPADAAAVPALRALLADSTSVSWARVQALRSLGAITEAHPEQARAVRDALLEHLMREQHPGALEVLFDALAVSAGEIEIPFLIATIEREERPTPRRAAIRALGKCGGDEAIALLTVLSASPDAWTRSAVATALGSIGSGGGPLLTSLLRDDDRRVRTAAAEAVASIDAPFRFPLLSTVLEDSDLAVRATAVTAFAKERPEEWRAALTATWENSQNPEYWELRHTILGAFAEHAPDEARILAEKGLSDPFLTVRMASVAILERPLPSADEIAPPMGLPFPRLDDPFETDAPLHATIVTARGTMVVALFLEEAPRHVSSFVALADRGDYDGLHFHRVVPSFVVQGADPRGDGWGDAGYHLIDELHSVEYVRGTLGMPKAGDHTGGCQIFITHLPTPHLDGRYTVFGQVIEGLDVLDRIEVGDKIESIRIEGVAAERGRPRRAEF